MFGATESGEALPGTCWRLGVPRVEEFSDFSEFFLKKAQLAPAGIRSTLHAIITAAQEHSDVADPPVFPEEEIFTVDGLATRTFSNGADNAYAQH